MFVHISIGSIFISIHIVKISFYFSFSLKKL